MLIQTWRSSFPIVPFRNARQGWNARESLLVALTCPASGVCGLGEASPLEGFSRESIDDVEGALRSLDLETLTLEAPLGELLGTPQLSTLPPSARFAVETALLDGISQVRRMPIERLLLEQLMGESASQSDVFLEHTHVSFEASSGLSSFPTATVIDIFEPDYLEHALDWHDQGLSTFKVKVGFDLPRETSLLRAWSTRFCSEGKIFELRLDANQSLTEAEFDACCDWWRALPVAYLEEPCPLNVLRSLLSSARDALPLPIALDETLSEGRTIVEPWLDRLSALVCKPMYLGGITPVLEWAKLARSLDLPIVVSHLLDGPLAMRLYRALAGVVAPNTAAGLGPHPGLSLWNNHLRPRDDGLGLGFELRPLAV